MHCCFVRRHWRGVCVSVSIVSGYIFYNWLKSVVHDFLKHCGQLATVRYKTFIIQYFGVFLLLFFKCLKVHWSNTRKLSSLLRAKRQQMNGKHRAPLAGVLSRGDSHGADVWSRVIFHWAPCPLHCGNTSPLLRCLRSRSHERALKQMSKLVWGLNMYIRKTQTKERAQPSGPAAQCGTAVWFRVLLA